MIELKIGDLIDHSKNGVFIVDIDYPGDPDAGLVPWSDVAIMYFYYANINCLDDKEQHLANSFLHLVEEMFDGMEVICSLRTEDTNVVS